MIFCLFLLFPFLACVWAFTHMKHKWSKMIIILFWGVIGFTRHLVASEDATVTNYALMDFANFDYNQFLLYRFASGWKESLNFLYWNIMFLLSKLQYTAVIWSFILMTSCWVMIYCYRLQLLNANLSYQKNNEKYILTFLLLFFLFLPLSSYGTKFYCAAFFFMVGIYTLTYKEKKVGIIIAFLSCLCHYTFIYLIALSAVAYFTRNKSLPLKILILLTFVLLGFIAAPLALESDAIYSKVEVYTDMEATSARYESKAGWIMLDRYLIAVYPILFLFYVHFKKIVNQKSDSVYYFLIVYIIGLIPLIFTYDALDRFSRIFSFMTILFVIKLLNTTRLQPMILKIGIAVYSYHSLVALYLRKTDWDFSILYDNLISILLSSDLMTTVIQNT